MNNLFCQIVFTNKYKYAINREKFSEFFDMSISRWMLWALCIPLAAFFSMDKKREETYSYDKDKSDANPLKQMLRDFPCEEGRGIWYEIQDEEGTEQVCVLIPTQFEM